MAKALETQDHRALELFAPELIHESRNCSNVHSLPPDSSRRETLLMQHDGQQRTVNFQPTVIVNEAELSEAIHKEVNSSSGRTDHFRQCFLAYLRNHVLRSLFLSKAGQQQKDPGQPLLSRIEKLVN